MVSLEKIKNKISPLQMGEGGIMERFIEKIEKLAEFLRDMLDSLNLALNDLIKKKIKK